MEGQAPRIIITTSSEDTKAPRVVCKAPRIHLHMTRRNTAMSTVIEEVIQNEGKTEWNLKEYYNNPRESAQKQEIIRKSRNTTHYNKK